MGQGMCRNCLAMFLGHLPMPSHQNYPKTYPTLSPLSPNEPQTSKCSPSPVF